MSEHSPQDLIIKCLHFLNRQITRYKNSIFDEEYVATLKNYYEQEADIASKVIYASRIAHHYWINDNELFKQWVWTTLDITGIEYNDDLDLFVSFGYFCKDFFYGKGWLLYLLSQDENVDLNVRLHCIQESANLGNTHALQDLYNLYISMNRCLCADYDLKTNYIEENPLYKIILLRDFNIQEVTPKVFNQIRSELNSRINTIASQAIVATREIYNLDLRQTIVEGFLGHELRIPYEERKSIACKMLESLEEREIIELCDQYVLLNPYCGYPKITDRICEFYDHATDARMWCENTLTLANFYYDSEKIIDSFNCYRKAFETIKQFHELIDIHSDFAIKYAELLINICGKDGFEKGKEILLQSANEPHEIGSVELCLGEAFFYGPKQYGSIENPSAIEYSYERLLISYTDLNFRIPYDRQYECAKWLRKAATSKDEYIKLQANILLARLYGLQGRIESAELLLKRIEFKIEKYAYSGKKLMLFTLYMFYTRGILLGNTLKHVYGQNTNVSGYMLHLLRAYGGNFGEFIFAKSKEIALNKETQTLYKNSYPQIQETHIVSIPSNPLTYGVFYAIINTNWQKVGEQVASHIIQLPNRGSIKISITKHDKNHDKYSDIQSAFIIQDVYLAFLSLLHKMHPTNNQIPRLITDLIRYTHHGEEPMRRTAYGLGFLNSISIDVIEVPGKSGLITAKNLNLFSIEEWQKYWPYKDDRWKVNVDNDSLKKLLQLHSEQGQRSLTSEFAKRWYIFFLTYNWNISNFQKFGSWELTIKELLLHLKYLPKDLPQDQFWKANKAHRILQAFLEAQKKLKELKLITFETNHSIEKDGLTKHDILRIDGNDQSLANGWVKFWLNSKIKVT